jgi:hypothetical protein
MGYTGRIINNDCQCSSSCGPIPTFKKCTVKCRNKGLTWDRAQYKKGPSGCAQCVCIKS